MVYKQKQTTNNSKGDNTMKKIVTINSINEFAASHTHNMEIKSRRNIAMKIAESGKRISWEMLEWYFISLKPGFNRWNLFRNEVKAVYEIGEIVGKPVRWIKKTGKKTYLVSQNWVNKEYTVK